MKDYFYGKEPDSFWVEAARHFKANSKVLCIGDDEGRNSVYLAKFGHFATSKPSAFLTEDHFNYQRPRQSKNMKILSR